MKVAVLADIHGNLPALEAVLACVRLEAQAVLFLGDLCGYYAFVNECAGLLSEFAVTGVRGNHDELLVRHLDHDTPLDDAYTSACGSALGRTARSLSKPAANLLRRWPLVRDEVIDGTRIYLAHGAPWDPLNGRVYPDFQDWQRFASCEAEVILLGHTHYPLIKKWEDKLIVNPGSVGQARGPWRGRACWATLTLPSLEPELRQANYDASAVVDDATRHDPNLPYLVNILRP